MGHKFLDYCSHAWQYILLSGKGLMKCCGWMEEKSRERLQWICMPPYGSVSLPEIKQVGSGLVMTRDNYPHQLLLSCTAEGQQNPETVSLELSLVLKMPSQAAVPACWISLFKLHCLSQVWGINLNSVQIPRAYGEFCFVRCRTHHATLLFGDDEM